MHFIVNTVSNLIIIIRINLKDNDVAQFYLLRKWPIGNHAWANHGNHAWHTVIIPDFYKGRITTYLKPCKLGPFLTLSYFLLFNSGSYRNIWNKISIYENHIYGHDYYKTFFIK